MAEHDDRSLLLTIIKDSGLSHRSMNARGFYVAGRPAIRGRSSARNSTRSSNGDRSEPIKVKLLANRRMQTTER